MDLNKQNKIKDFFLLGLGSITKRRMRSWLTMLGIIIGIMAVVALISLGQGLQNTVEQQFKKAGSNRIIISPGGSLMPIGGGSFLSAKLTEDDVDAVRRVRGVETAGGLLTSTLIVKFNDQSKYVSIFGHDTDSKTMSMIEDISFFALESGRNPKSGDTYKVVLGNDVANSYFNKTVKIGDKILISKKEFEVIGIQKHAGTYIHDQIIRMPKSTLRELTNDTSNSVNTIYALIAEGANTRVEAESIKKELRRERNVKEGKEDFSVQTAESIMNSFESILSIVQIVLIGLASISLVVGGVGIMNTMYTSILERTKDIGIMKAVGARNSDILLIFLIESGIMGLVGGAIGIISGIAIAKLVEIIAASLLGGGILVVVFPYWLILGALLFSFFTGCIAGLLPAYQASRMEPVDALRH